MWSLNMGSIKDIKKALRDMGYSSRAVDEILKWYRCEKAADERK
ncbi:MAG: hypothetical protein QXJ11_05435 [Candidatus Bathyarchaeia archaeon]